MRRNLPVMLLASGWVLAACTGTAAPVPGANFSGPIEISGVASGGRFWKV